MTRALREDHEGAAAPLATRVLAQYDGMRQKRLVSAAGLGAFSVWGDGASEICAQIDPWCPPDLDCGATDASPRMMGRACARTDSVLPTLGTCARSACRMQCHNSLVSVLEARTSEKEALRRRLSRLL